MTATASRSSVQPAPQPGTFAYEETKRVAAALSQLGCDIITGGGPGLMQAANEGAAGIAGPGGPSA